MGYITKDDLVQAYGQVVVNRVGSPNYTGIPDDTVIQKAITSAEGIIDGFVSTRYTIPLVVVPRIVVDIAIDIAIYKMALGPMARTPEMRTRYEDAMSLLDRIAKGSISLDLSERELAANGDEDLTKNNLARSIRTFRM